jgi:hypothetical protein
MHDGIPAGAIKLKRRERPIFGDALNPNNNNRSNSSSSGNNVAETS